MVPPDSVSLRRILEIYDGSDADATKGLYRDLCKLGPAGELAMNLFRAQKASARAKVYRGGVPGRGSFRTIAYEKKGWAIEQAVQILQRYAVDLNVRWGWQCDLAAQLTQAAPEWILYVDLPTGQVSFHATARGKGPEYDQPWDRVVGASPGRILRWCECLLTVGSSRQGLTADRAAEGGEALDDGAGRPLGHAGARPAPVVDEARAEEGGR